MGTSRICKSRMCGEQVTVTDRPFRPFFFSVGLFSLTQPNHALLVRLFRTSLNQGVMRHPRPVGSRWPRPGEGNRRRKLGSAETKSKVPRRNRATRRPVQIPGAMRGLGAICLVRRGLISERPDADRRKDYQMLSCLLLALNRSSETRSPHVG